MLGLAILGENKDEAGKFALFCFWCLAAMIGVGCCAFTFTIANILFPGLIWELLTLVISGLLASIVLLALLYLFACFRKPRQMPTASAPTEAPIEPSAGKEE
ncbi:MAG: hypothetical protein K2W82_17775 [Candidatus Obscuribacterales bacterium]|nr:hypothetical protein [Candidatus Obscuribacterales bacterium]